MKELLFNTHNDATGLLLRLTVGLIMLPHGAQKLFGMFGGFGYAATMNFFTQTLRLPWLVALLVIVLEFFGALGLLAGFATRLWALGLIIIMVGAIVTTNYKHGLFMNWFGTQAGEGYEYHLLVIGCCMALVINGSGKLSIDALVAGR